MMLHHIPSSPLCVYVFNARGAMPGHCLPFIQSYTLDVSRCMATFCGCPLFHYRHGFRSVPIALYLSNHSVLCIYRSSTAAVRDSAPGSDRGTGAHRYLPVWDQGEPAACCVLAERRESGKRIRILFDLFQHTQGSVSILGWLLIYTFNVEHRVDVKWQFLKWVIKIKSLICKYLCWGRLSWFQKEWINNVIRARETYLSNNNNHHVSVAGTVKL